MDEPAYKEQIFICVKCLKKYKITLTAKSEIVLIEELKGVDKEGEKVNE